MHTYVVQHSQVCIIQHSQVHVSSMSWVRVPPEQLSFSLEKEDIQVCVVLPCFDLGQLRIIQYSQYVQFSYSAQLKTMQTNFFIILYFHFFALFLFACVFGC